MGVAISHHAALAPVSLASTIVGFIGFAISIATLLRVFWDSVQTIQSAPTQIGDFLSNLGQGLQEERRHLRRVRQRLKRQRRDARSRSGGGAANGAGDKRGGGGGGGGRKRSRPRGRPRSWRVAAGREYDDASPYDGSGGGGGGGGADGMDYAHSDIATRVLRDTVRHLSRRFRELEEPFLKYPGTGTLGPDPWSEREKRLYEDAGELEEVGGERSWEKRYYRTEYRKCGLRERWIWLHSKSDVLSLMDGLSRIETRRSAMELGWITGTLKEMEGDVRDFEDRLLGLEQRLSRVVGVSNVD